MLDRLNILKRIVKEARNIIVWQETINTALHNIDAAWVVSGTITWAQLAANFPRTIAQLLSDHNLANHVLGTIVPHDALASLTEKSHGSLTDVTADQHHTKYTDAEAQATVKANVEVGDLKAPTADLDMNGRNIVNAGELHGMTYWG